MIAQINRNFRTSHRVDRKTNQKDCMIDKRAKFHRHGSTRTAIKRTHLAIVDPMFLEILLWTFSRHYRISRSRSVLIFFYN